MKRIRAMTGSAALAASVAWTILALGGGCGTSSPSSDPAEDAAPDVALDGALAPDVVTDAGCKVDTASDPKNCGQCGHDCLGGACESGACKPFTLAAAEVSWLEADDEAIYFSATTGELNRLPFDGGSPKKIGANLELFITGMTDKSIVGKDSASDIRAFAKDGSEVDGGRVFSGALVINGSIGAAGKYFVYSTQAGGVNVVDETSGTITALNATAYFQIVAGADRVFMRSSANTFTTFALPPPTDGTTIAPEATAFTAGWCTRAADDLLCASGTALVTIPFASLTSTPKLVFAAQMSDYPSAGFPRAFAGDAKDVYWRDATSGALVTCAKSACTTPKEVAPDVGAGALVTARSARAIVWFDDTKNEIRAIAR